MDDLEGPGTSLSFPRALQARRRPDGPPQPISNPRSPYASGVAGSFEPVPQKRGCRRHDSYLVDSASSHMLVFKIKPCMSKYKQSIP